jgi:hypothetical protein
VATGELNVQTGWPVLLAFVGLLSLPYLLDWLLWLVTGRGMAAKTAEQLDHAGKIRRAERIWALQAVCMTAVTVVIYVATMILCRRDGLISY